MIRNSLRLRLLLGGLTAILVALTIAGFALSVLFERHVARTISDDLDVYLKQLIAGLDIDANGRLVVNDPPADPRFADPLSGLYWQVGDDRSQLLRSRSLWDATLSLAADDPSPSEVHHHRTSGPAGSRVLLAERRVRLVSGDQQLPVRLAVAADLTRLSVAGAAFATDLVIALGLLGLVLAIATSVQVALGLRPLALLSKGVAEIRSGVRHRLPAAVPNEVEPLVAEVNALLDAQEIEVERSRGRAADLAHGLKTPLAALATDARRLRDKGEHAMAAEIEAVADQMLRHVDRELVRARIRGGIHQSMIESGELRSLIRSLVATLSRTPEGQKVSFEVDVADGAAVAFDRSDLAEVLGNLLENAARHAASKVRISAGPRMTGRFIAIEDDGAGIEPAARSIVLKRGGRLDEHGGSAGLGLAIVQDVLEAYNWQIEFAHSNLGGLKVEISPTTQ